MASLHSGQYDPYTVAPPLAPVLAFTGAKRKAFRSGPLVTAAPMGLTVTNFKAGTFFVYISMCVYTSNQTEGTAPNLEGTEHCACLHLRMTARAATQLFDAALKPKRIRSTQFTLLVMIARFAPVAIGRLAAILVIDRTTLTRSLHLMQKGGLVAVSQRSNMRQRFVTLSAKVWRSWHKVCRSGERLRAISSTMSGSCIASRCGKGSKSWLALLST